MKTVDCLGLQCPEPLIRTRAAIEQGENELAVLVDNETSLENVSKYLVRCGFAANVEKQNGGSWCIRACRTSDKPLPEEEPACSVSASDDTGKTLVLITTQFLGHGDDALGAKLMANFLKTLPEMRHLWRLVFLNGGVKLTAEPGPALDAIKKLADSGVSVLVCGTCLSHYGLLEKKQVGETSNMLDIVTSLELADKVIRP